MSRDSSWPCLARTGRLGVSSQDGRNVPMRQLIPLTLVGTLGLLTLGALLLGLAQH